MPEIKTGKENNYADLLTQCFDIIDSHTHDKIGKSINQASILWEAMDFSNYSILNSNYINLYNLNNSLSNANTFFVKNRDLYFVDGNLNEIQITKKGFVNTTSPFDGGFTGDYVQSGATCDYIDSISAYNFLASNGNVNTSLYFSNIDTIVGDISVTNITTNQLNCTYIRPSYYDDKVLTQYSMIAFDENQNLFMSNFYYNSEPYFDDLTNFFHYFNTSDGLRKSNPFQIKSIKTKFISYNPGETSPNDIISQSMYKCTGYVVSPNSIEVLMRKSYSFKPTTALSGITLLTIDSAAISNSIVGCSVGTNFSFKNPEIAICCNDGIVFYGDNSGPGYKVQLMCYYKRLC